MTTLVTAWVSTQREPHFTVRTNDEYVLLARHVFSLGYPIIAFVDPSIQQQLEALADELSACVTFVPTEQHITSADRMSKLQGLLNTGKIPGVLTNPNRDSADYFGIQLSKADWIHHASNLTDDSDLWWIDLGLAHVSPIVRDQALAFPHGASCVIACDYRLIDHINQLATDDRKSFERNWPVAAGGMFAVRSAFAEEFRDLWWQIVDDFIVHEIAPTDELVLSQIALHDDRAATVDGIHQRLFESFSTAETNRNSDSTSSRALATTALPALVHTSSATVIDLASASGWLPGWSTFNPSVATDNNGTILCLVRSSNYDIDGYTYSNIDGSDDIKTQTQCLTLDSDFNVIDSFWIIEPDIIQREPQFPVHGIEDMRLAFDGAHWIVTGTIRQHDPQGYCRQIIAKLNVQSQSLEDVSIMASPVTPWATNIARVHEKNWMALPSESVRQEFVWSTDPLVVVEWDWLTGNVAPKLGKPQVMNVHGLRGSTPFVNTPIGRLGIVHEVSRTHTWPTKSGGPARRYSHRFVVIDDSNGLAMSEPFSFVGEGLEYAAGLALVDSQIVVSIGQNDKTAHLIRIHLQEVQKLLHN